MNHFQILHKDGKARTGQMVTPHGIIETPNFIPVGTQASVKALSPKDLKEAGEILYHNLATLHNVYFILNLMKKIREAIKDNSLSKFKKQWL